MTDLSKSTDAEEVVKLLVHYGFDLDGHCPERLIQSWRTRYSYDWIRLAVIEALYQGRYKVISVEQILMIWQRRQKPIPHFNGEFQRIVSSSLPTLRDGALAETEPASASDGEPQSLAGWAVRGVRAKREGESSKGAALPYLADAVARSPRSVASEQAFASVVSIADGTDQGGGDRRSATKSQGLWVDIEPIDVIEPFAIATAASASESAVVPPLTAEPLHTSTSSEKTLPSTLPSTYAASPPTLSTSDDRVAQWSVYYPVRSPSISQFVPTSRASGFYSRLKAIVQHHGFLGAEATETEP